MRSQIFLGWEGEFHFKTISLKKHLFAKSYALEKNGVIKS